MSYHRLPTAPLASRHRGAGGGAVDNRHPQGPTYLHPKSVQSIGATSWNPAVSGFTVKQSKVKDFSTDSRHNYAIYLSLAEFQSLLLAISDAAISDPTTFEKGLSSSLKPLIRLQAVVAGTVG